MEKKCQKTKLKQVEVRLKLISRSPLYSERMIQSAADAVAVMADTMACLDREHLCVVNLDASGHPLNFNVVSIGDVKNSFVSMQSLFKSAILSNASYILVLHNHPGGSMYPTGPDMEATKRIISAGRLMSIPVLDHVIVAGLTGKYYSMRENKPKLFENNAEKKICAEETCCGNGQCGEMNMGI